MNSRAASVLVTGGHGLLGSALVRRIAAERRDVDTLVPRRAELDLLDAGQVDRYLGQHAVDVVIHLAADCGGIGYNRANPASMMVSNTTMGLNIFTAAHRHGVGKIVCASSCDAYPAAARVPWREDALWDGRPEETSVHYGLAKRHLVALGEAFHRQYGLQSVHLILINMFGEGDTFSTERGHIVPATIAKVAEARRTGSGHVRVWGDGSPRRELLYAGDAAQAVLHAMDRASGFTCLNVGSGSVRSVREIVMEVGRQMGFEGEFVFDPSRPNGHPLKVLDTTRLRDMLGGDFAVTPFEEALRRTIAAFTATVGGAQPPGAGDGRDATALA